MNCHACKNGKYKILSTGIYECTLCQHVYRNYKYIDPKKYYNQKYRKTHPVYPYHIRKQYCQNFVTTVKNIFEKVKTGLEIGSGDGVLLETIAENFEIYLEACEIDKKLAANIEKKFKTHNINFLNLQTEKQYDMVVAMDILEHCYDLEEAKSKILQLSKKYIVIQVPVDRRYEFDEPFNGHYHYFSLKSIKKVFESECKLIFSHKTEWAFTTYGPSLIVVFEKEIQR